MKMSVAYQDPNDISIQSIYKVELTHQDIRDIPHEYLERIDTMMMSRRMSLVLLGLATIARLVEIAEAKRRSPIVIEGEIVEDNDAD